MEVISVETDQLNLLAEGNDPYFVLRVPPELYRAVTPWRILHWALLSLLAGGFWWWLERRLSPRMHSPLLMVVVCSSVTVVGMLYISGRPIIGDGVENLSYALNLANEGVFSHQAGDDLQPTYRREVLPPLVTAAYLKLFFSSDRRAEMNFQGSYAQQVKYVNLAWIFLAFVALWRLSFRLSGSDAFAGFMVVVAAFGLFYERNLLDNLYTELPAAALLLLGSYFLLRSTQQDAQHLLWAGLAGLTLGLLALTKSVFFYVAPVGIVLLALAIWVSPLVRGGSARRAGGFLLIAALGYTMVVLPWILRNHFLLDTADPSGRSGIIYSRAVLNQMSHDEIFGHLFFYGPALYHRLVAGTALSEQPGDFQRGGRWERINRGPSDFLADDLEAARAGNPEDAISFHRRFIAERVALQRVYSTAGVDNLDVILEAGFRQRGLDMIRTEPLRHLWMSGVFAATGVWGFPKLDLPYVPAHMNRELVELVNGIALLAFLVVFGVALWRRDPRWLAVTLLPAGMIMFYALTSHYNARYTAPANPILLLMLGVLVFYAARKLMGLVSDSARKREQ
jgi:4-amino-4-deoxy-L-arabinose transferase-like glycosyltransferase